MSKFMFAFSSFSWIVLSFYLSSLKAAELGTSSQYQWNNQTKLNLKNRILLAQDFPPDRRSTSTSGPCSAEQNIIPVVPITPVSTDFIYRRSDTTESHPSFWFYIPYASVASAEFILTEWQKSVPNYATSIEISETPGVVRIQIPTTTEALQDGKWYETKLSVRVRCRPGTPLRTETVRSWVRRNTLTPELSRRINQTKPPLQKAIAYAEAGFWYDALKTLDAGVYPLNTDAWTALLQKYGLDKEVLRAPKANCCTPEVQKDK